jgi:hypothetical protein
MSKYRKTIAALGGFFGVLAASLADGAISGSEATSIVLAAAGVVAVYAFPNKGGNPDV